MNIFVLKFIPYLHVKEQCNLFSVDIIALKTCCLVKKKTDIHAAEMQKSRASVRPGRLYFNMGGGASTI